MDPKRHDTNAKLEAKMITTLSSAYLMQLKLGKVIRWNLLIIMSKRQQVKGPKTT